MCDCISCKYVCNQVTTLRNSAIACNHYFFQDLGVTAVISVHEKKPKWCPKEAPEECIRKEINKRKLSMIKSR